MPEKSQENELSFQVYMVNAQGKKKGFSKPVKKIRKLIPDFHAALKGSKRC